jgi:hypothetical protein
MRKMNYQKASPNSGRGISASQWNGFLDMHRDYYGGNASNGPLPPILSQSVIAQAVLQDDMEAIKPFQPVRIVKTINFVNVLDGLPSYIVEPVDATDGERHGNYGFTLSEGCTPEGGGRIVVSGIALVQMDAGELYYNKVVSPSRGQHEGSFDSSYYVVPDNTLSLDDKLIAPTGHFKLLSWYDPVEIGKFEEADKVYVALDMGQRPTSFLAKVDATIAASTEASEVITMSSGTAYAYYGVSESTAATGDMEVQKDEDAYGIEVYNTSAEAIPSGDHLLSYSLEYNRFIVLVAGGQTVKIGKADADIAVDATGTISIWRDGADTTENETAKLDWMAGTTQVSSGKEVLITWFADEGIWRITGAECE